jgi:hypothetical protein
MKQLKNPGITLLSSIIVSGIILTLVLSFMRIILKDIELNADFFEGERAYFAAESGIEHGLLTLRSQPTKDIQDQKISLESAQAILNIDNKKNKEVFVLSSFENQKFSLRMDPQAVNIERLEIKVVRPNSSNVTGDADRIFQWKLQCRKKGGTVSIQGIKDKLIYQGGKFSSFIGQWDRVGGVTVENKYVTALWTDLNKSEKQTCFLSFQNITNDPLEFTLGGTSFSPSVATITSMGQSHNRQKIITFDMAQKNLSTLFDFGIFDDTKPKTSDETVVD